LRYKEKGKRVKYNMDVEDVSNIYGGGQYIEWSKKQRDPKFMI